MGEEIHFFNIFTFLPDESTQKNWNNILKEAEKITFPHKSDGQTDIRTDGH